MENGLDGNGSDTSGAGQLELDFSSRPQALAAEEIMFAALATQMLGSLGGASEEHIVGEFSALDTGVDGIVVYTPTIVPIVDASVCGVPIYKRDLNAMFSATGEVYTGEVPQICLEWPKPSLDDILALSEDTRKILGRSACAGVIKRDATRGRPLPNEIMDVLMSQMSQEENR